MDGMVKVSCPQGCDFLILGEVHEAMPLLWEHLVLAHNLPSVSYDQVFEMASCIIPARAARQ